ncbi:phosphoenolpyruvate synthase [Chengkuizengella marina]|uniref:Phosphoenolpyruvate synthase n=1 Tax=Chengkuizengella marina TaxID=2507566 RepID=A0A6N9Q5Q9_9BACL|nr:phosphoenolpyruvate synthase [Chengkuizengella marina]NBI29964.1 phosphoenolpyruvate synthase [Chengkuizengella marina]
MRPHVLFFNEINRTSLLYVGGKGANLGELSKAGFPVPGGFCVTTYAYKDFIATSSQIESLLDELNDLDSNDLNQLRELGKRIRTHLQHLAIPIKLKNKIIHAWESVGKQYAYAVRSSATAEDLPTASFAGQHDTYLNIKGKEQLLQHIRQCWASLFTDRAISYRSKNGFNHREVYLSVVVQRMVNPNISGIMFTADPIKGNRKVVSIDASFGLGEALVSGIVSADLYKVKEDIIIEKNISDKKLAIFSLSKGGTVKKELTLEQQTKQAMIDSQILSLAKIGKQIEDHFESPQDIEFCFENDEIFIVQSRPVTSLYPLPNIEQEPLRVLISFGHIQVMTDAIKPLGLSVIRTLFKGGGNVILETGGRIYFDPTEILRHKLGRRFLPKILNNVDENISRAIKEIIQRDEIVDVPPKPGLFKDIRKFVGPILKEGWKNYRKSDPKLVKDQIEAYLETKLNEIRQDLDNSIGVDRLKKVQFHLNTLGPNILENVIPKNILPFLFSTIFLRKLYIRWIGDDKEFQKLNKSLPGNVTSEMGLQIGDLADLVRELPKVEEYLKNAKDQTFYEGLNSVDGGERFKHAFELFISKYGMRCPGEIDLTKPRWREAPTQLIPAILGHMRSVKSGEHREKFTLGELESQEAAQKIINCVKHNRFKTKLVKRQLELYHHLAGLREHHKYMFVSFLDECKKAILSEAEVLVKKGVLQERKDVYFLSLDELIEVLEGEYKQNKSQSISDRKETYEYHQKLKPPRVMTSEGEIITGSPKQGDFPKNALVGSPASAGVIEGKARIILSPETAMLNEGEILVAPHTDPGWTPLFQSARALVTEVGGLMTHGSVVAREYGIPAVVGLDDATKKLKDGQLIRVDGNQGFVEILSDE